MAVTSLQRSVVPFSPAVVSAQTLWRIVLATLAVVAFITTRAVGYQFGTVFDYAAYVALYIALPGVVALHFVMRRPLSLTSVVALALPTGFALEIFSFLGLAALHAKSLYVWTPLLWVGAAVALRMSRRQWPVRVHLAANHAGVGAALVVVFLGTAVMAASQMFAESPLAGGLPTRAIFHDWVYLVSRATVIKNNWPLDDPSLSGTPLQYHYFMMVHAAAASWTTKVEITAVLLRLVFVPLGAVLVAQAFALGRALSRTPWGGVMAAVLLVAASEVSLSTTYGEPMFLGLFVRWLFVSPTFFFGMIFCGALLIALAQCMRRPQWDVRYYAWLLLLGTAGTGAKGTVLPVLICALGLWAMARWWRERRVPVQLIVCGAFMVVAFAAVYVPTMLAWRTGDAAFRPFHVFHLSGFWKEHLDPWTQSLAHWLPAGAATWVATFGCATVVFAGTCGVRLLAIPYLLWSGSERRDAQLASWLGAFFVASGGMGMLMELNSYGELYVLLMMRLPMAVLTAGFFVATARRLAVWWREQHAAPASPAVETPGVRRASPWFARAVLGGTALTMAVTLTLQTSLWWTRNRDGLAEWWKTPADLKPDAYMRELQEALLWVRQNTEPNAVLVANAFTPENMRKDHWGALDHTLMGVHFYYSAYSERRMWFEGPNYILDTTRARLRANLASNFFYRDRPLRPSVVSRGPSYILIDHNLADGAKVSLAAHSRVFSNRRIDVYRLSDTLSGQ